MKVTVVVECDPCCPGIRMVPGITFMREQVGPPPPTAPANVGRLDGAVIMALTLSASQQVGMSVSFLDARGNPAQVDGAPTWLVDAPAVLSLTPAPDGMSCLAAAVGPLGNARVSVRADADLGAGVVEVVGILDFTITAGQAATVQISAGTPSEQP